MEALTLHEIDNLDDYLVELDKYKHEYLICAAAKDTLYGIDDKSIDALRKLGMKNVPKGWNGYVFLMKNGKVYIDMHSDDNIPLVQQILLQNSEWQIVSKAWRSGNKARLIVDEIDLSVNGRGLNIAVINPVDGKLVDSVCLDFFPGSNSPCIHKKYSVPIYVLNIGKENRNECYDIDKEFNDIIKKYELDEYYPRYTSVYDSRKIIRELATRWDKTESIACIVIGSSDDKMYLDESFFLEALTYYEKNQVDFYRCIIREDNAGLVNFYNWEAYDFSKLNSVVWDGYAYVYIVSNQGENFVGEWLRRKNIKYESLCDVLYLHGISSIPTNTEHYEFIPDKRESRFFYKNSQTSPIQWEYYEQSTKYHTYESIELKNVCAQKCFFLSLILKDFFYAEEWLKKLDYNDDSSERYREAWQCVQNLIQSIRMRLKKRQQKDIVAVWVDHTLYNDVDMMPFVSSLKDKSIWFENIFTLTGYTRETMRGLFTGRKLIDDNTGEINSINLSNSPILRSLYKQGYKTKILLKPFRIMFPWRYRDRASIYSFVQTSELLWDSVSLLLKSKNPGFVLAPIEETHPPYISLGTSKENVFSEVRRAKEAYKETDRQIQFYISMLGDNSTTVIFSDHGGFSDGKLGKFWPRHQVFLSIYGKRYHPRKVDGLCSSIDFYKIMNQIIQGEEIQEEKLQREFVEIQGVPIISNRMQIEGNGTLLQAAPAFWPPFRGYKGVVTDEYVYIYFAGGREWLSRREKLQPRLSWYVRPDDVCDKKLIPYMRNKAGIDYGKEPNDYGPSSNFYRVTMDAYKKNYPYNETKLHLINFLIAHMSVSSVALYLGNEVSREAYLALSLENRKKIDCIIDKAANCACADLDVPVVSLENVTNRGIRNIVVSSRTLPVELKDFLINHGQTIHAFGLYGWFEVNGYHTKHNFYDFAIQSMDAPLPTPLSILDFLNHAAPGCLCEVSVVMVVQDESTLLSRLHDILRQVSLGMRIYCLDLTGKAAEVVKDYQKVTSCIEVIRVDGYSSLPEKMNELISSANTKYILFLSADEYLHAKGLFYLHEIAEQMEAEVVAAGLTVTAKKDGKTDLTDFSTGSFELKKEASILPPTFNERYAEWSETGVPSFTGSRLYRVDFLRKYNIIFPAVRFGWRDIFCLQTIFESAKYVKVPSPVCISSNGSLNKSLDAASVENVKELVADMFAYQQAIETLLRQMNAFGNNSSLCDKFRERAMTIFDQQYFSGIALDDEIRKAVSQTVQEKLQKNPSIGMWWIKYLFMRSSFPQNV